MRLPHPSDVGTTDGLIAWARRLITAISGAWGVEHTASGRHRFPWNTLDYSGFTFTGSGSMTWTVDQADQNLYEYRLIDDTLEIRWRIRNTDVGGTASNELRMSFPAGYLAAADSANTHWYSDAGTEGVGFAGTLAGDTFIRLYKLGSGNWTLTTSDNTSTAGYLAIRVQ